MTYVYYCIIRRLKYAVICDKMFGLSIINHIKAGPHLKHQEGSPFKAKQEAIPSSPGKTHLEDLAKSR